MCCLRFKHRYPNVDINANEQIAAMELRYNITDIQTKRCFYHHAPKLPSQQAMEICVFFTYIPPLQIECKFHCSRIPLFRLAASTVVLDFLSGQGDRFSTLGRSRLSLHSRLDLTCHGQESLLNVGGSLG